MEQQEPPKIGDVIRSVHFAQGHSPRGNFHSDRTWVGVGFGEPDQELFDETRSQRNYVVEDVVFVPAGEGSVSCYLILARELTDAGSYEFDANGIAFYMLSDWNAPFIDEGIEIVGEMERIFSFRPKK